MHLYYLNTHFHQIQNKNIILIPYSSSMSSSQKRNQFSVKNKKRKKNTKPKKLK